jgi:hypothetical protein
LHGVSNHGSLAALEVPACLSGHARPEHDYRRRHASSKASVPLDGTSGDIALLEPSGSSATCRSSGAIPERFETNEQIFESFENSRDETTRFTLSRVACRVAPVAATPGAASSASMRHLFIDVAN